MVDQQGIGESFTRCEGASVGGQVETLPLTCSANDCLVFLP